MRNKMTIFWVTGVLTVILFTVGILGLSSRQEVSLACVEQQNNCSSRKPTDNKSTFSSPEGLVPDEETAISIAEAVLFPIYGKDKIMGERPFKATLHEGTWFVVGTLPDGMRGGVSEVEISKTNAAIVRISHGQ